MKYYFIYSAGGGAGDWNGLKRVWNSRMPGTLKNKILLKFGDVFFNHASSVNLVKPRLWSSITNMRSWLFNNVNDSYVRTNSIILLDSGSSKMVNHITTQNNHMTPQQVIAEFNHDMTSNQIMDKYVQIVNNSSINYAVTFDIPNPFKIRTQSQVTQTSIFSSQHNTHSIPLCASYANDMYRRLGNSQLKILTTINGQWTAAELNSFLNQLSYTPDKLAIGGLTRVSPTIMRTSLNRINSKIPLAPLSIVHMLGCGGIKRAQAIKNSGLTTNNFSVDNSTPWNRSIDGNLAGTAQSGYFDYQNKKLHRIKPNTRTAILTLHSQYSGRLFDVATMTNIIDKILQHQSNKSGNDTYEARASLAIHNHDVFRVNAI